MMVTYDPFVKFGLDIDKLFTPVTNSQIKTPAYPPYNLVKIDDDKFIMEFAVAGFSKGDVDISVEKGNLIIKGEKTEDEDKDYVHKGIATRKFIRTFSLPEFFEVDHAGMKDGILYIDLIRNIPEEKKPKKIKIS